MKLNLFCLSQLIRGVKVRHTQDQGNCSSAVVGKSKHGSPGPEKAGGSDDGIVVADGAKGGACKERSPQGVRRARHQGAASMAVSI
jgi:hypothetical protein